MSIFPVMRVAVTAIVAAAAAAAGAAAEGDTAMSPRLVAIDAAQLHQVMDNFGASDCWTMQKIGGWSPEGRDRIADLLFSRTEGIGLSCWRFNLGGGLDHERMGADSWRTVETFEVAEGEYDWTRQANERRMLAAAKARGVEQFVAFVNSPPARMTRSGRTFAEDSEESSNLKKGYEGQFARYLADIAQFFKENPDETQRVEFDWISPINEPQWPWVGPGQEGNPASNTVFKAVVTALYEALRLRGLETRILVPESGNMFAMYDEHRDLSARYGEKFGDYFDDFCNDPDINDKIGYVLCAHSYRADRLPEQFLAQRESFRKKFDEHPGWRYWMTEYCVMQGPDGEGGHGRDLTMKTALDVARVIHYDITLCNASAWQWWLAVSSYDYKDGLIYTDWRRPGDPETIYPSKLLWVLGHYSRFVRPGARRIALDGADDIHGLLGSAYLSPQRDALVIVFVNMGRTDERVSIAVDGISSAGPRRFTPYITSDAEGDDLRALDPTPADGYFTVPARSVVTLVGNLDAAG